MCDVMKVWNSASGKIPEQNSAHKPAVSAVKQSSICEM